MSLSKAIPAFVLMIAVSGANGQTTWYVDDGNACPGAGTQADPFCTIQQAIDDPNTVAGDEIVVSPGTYNEVINFNGKAITLRSTDPLDPAVVAVTIIDANRAGSVVTCNSGEGPDTVLDGFTITGGSATNGGGMFNDGSSPTVTNCTFSGNTAGRGGGMANVGIFAKVPVISSPTVTNCTFSGNTAQFEGGGMANGLSSPTVTNCTFSGNTGGKGGGMHNSILSDPTVTNCTFSENTASGAPDSAGSAGGGGMYNDISSDPTVTDCTFSANTAVNGGGMINFNGSNPTVTNCTFSGNSANSGSGGGMYNSTRNAGSSPTVSNCTFSANSAIGELQDNGDFLGGNGGGMYNDRDSSPTVSNCTFSGNSASGEQGSVNRVGGGGMYNFNTNGFLSPSPTVTNCTFSGNSVNGLGAHVGGGGMLNVNSNPTVTNCTFSENTAASGGGGGGMKNVNSNPTVDNCTFSGNTIAFGGGGGGMKNDNSHTTVTNCTFSGNSSNGGGGMINLNSSNTTVTNCTFTGNTLVAGTGGGMGNANNSSLTVTNCIFWGNSPDQISGTFIGVRFSDVQGGFAGTDNINADPLFLRSPSDGGDGWGDDPGTPDVDEGANDDFGDLRLMAESPCVNAGNATFLPPDTADLDGDGDVAEPTPLDLDRHARVLCGHVDMGAYEFGIGDDDCNGIVNHLDFAAFAACMTGPGGGPSDAGCEPFDFNGDADVDISDYALFLAEFDHP